MKAKARRTKTKIAEVKATTHMNSKSLSHLVAQALSLIATTLALTVVSTSLAGNPNPRVLPPNSYPHGKTYGEWAAAWQQWAFSLPVDHSPLFDTADCSAGQVGHVWFLGGTFSSVEVAPNVFLGRATRECTVPIGTALFFPILNNEGSGLEGNGTTEAELLAYNDFIISHAGDLECSVDGVALQDLQNYRVQSPLYTLGPLPENNILQSLFGISGTVGATTPSLTDGFYVMLAPLHTGNHTIHFSGVFTFTAAADGFDFILILDITYHITVQPGSSL